MLRHLSGKPFEYLFYCLDIKLKVRLAVRSLSSLVRQFIAQVYQPAPTSAQLNLTALRSLPGKMFGVFFFTLVLSHHIQKICTVGQSF